VRIPTEHAEALDRLAFERRLPKQEVVTELLARFIDDSPRRVTVELPEDPGLHVGHHSFRASENRVLSIAEAAELMQVEPEVIEQLAEAGELPGRKLGGEWRFARQALLDWLANSPQ
jgi:excisionase family DNA binding protein